VRNVPVVRIAGEQALERCHILAGNDGDGIGYHRLQHLGRYGVILDRPFQRLAGFPLGTELRVECKYEAVAMIEMRPCRAFL
jgi:hypothetical protein